MLDRTKIDRQRERNWHYIGAIPPKFQETISLNSGIWRLRESIEGYTPLERTRDKGITSVEGMNFFSELENWKIPP